MSSQDLLFQSLKKPSSVCPHQLWPQLQMRTCTPFLLEVEQKQADLWPSCWTRYREGWILPAHLFQQTHLKVRVIFPPECNFLLHFRSVFHSLSLHFAPHPSTLSDAVCRWVNKFYLLPPVVALPAVALGWEDGGMAIETPFYSCSLGWHQDR